MSKLGIFGGTFNPPHIGHARLAEHFVEKLGLDRLLVIPTAQPPHKEDWALSQDGANQRAPHRCVHRLMHPPHR